MPDMVGAGVDISSGDWNSSSRKTAVFKVVSSGHQQVYPPGRSSDAFVVK